MVEILKKSKEVKRSYFELLQDLNLKEKNYHLIFEYDGSKNRFDLDNQKKILFYEDCFVVVSDVDDRYLYDYDGVNSIELISFEREE